MGFRSAPILARELIDQRAFAGSGGAGESDDAGVAGVRKKSFEQIGPSGRVVLDGGDGAGEGAGIAGAEGIG